MAVIAQVIDLANTVFKRKIGSDWIGMNPPEGSAQPERPATGWQHPRPRG